MPGDPQEVKATPLNSTSIHVTWKPPLEKDRNGIIRGYHIHVQEVRDEVGLQTFSLFCFVFPFSHHTCYVFSFFKLTI